MTWSGRRMNADRQCRQPPRLQCSTFHHCFRGSYAESQGTLQPRIPWKETRRCENRHGAVGVVEPGAPPDAASPPCSGPATQVGAHRSGPPTCDLARTLPVPLLRRDPRRPRDLIARPLQVRNAVGHPRGCRLAARWCAKNCCIRMSMSFWLARLVGLCSSPL